MKIQVLAIIVASMASTTDAMYMKWLNVSRPELPANSTKYVRPWYFAKGHGLLPTPAVGFGAHVTSYPSGPGDESEDANEQMTLTATQSETSFVDSEPISKTYEQFIDRMPFATGFILNEKNAGETIGNVIGKKAEAIAKTVSDTAKFFQEGMKISKPWKREEYDEYGVKRKSFKHLDNDPDGEGLGSTCGFQDLKFHAREETDDESTDTTILTDSKYLPSV